ncbi:class I SAM-dependent methyltransferase [Brevibacillus nitrificans]|uniref:SAM-dependent methyltransferase n=1 Tax=Brevibacillus nitrificans TaxID=651560 RepID=UPI002E248EAC|nr:class I SAM-dependent methyltransferase [Brevibacillus nitrificans]
MDKEQLQTLYLQEEYYWGKEPNQLAKSVLNYYQDEPVQGKRAVDLGAGEGRDSVFLAKQGFAVTAMDFAPAGLEKAKRLAKEMGTTLHTVEGDINQFLLTEPVDLLYSIGALQYIHPENRAKQFKQWQECTAPGGLHVLFAFTRHPEVEIAPDWGENEYLYDRDELLGYYTGWETLHTEEMIFDCQSSGIPHRHAARILVSKKS